MATSTPAPFASIALHLDGAQPTVSVNHGTGVVLVSGGTHSASLLGSDPESLARVGRALIEASVALEARRVMDAQIAQHARNPLL